MPVSVRLRDYLFLLLALLLGYWMLLYYTLPNDNLDCWLPWRHFISKGFHNGMVPLWNPYLQLGYPAYADLQGPFFSLENFLTGTWFTTNLTVLQSILFAYVIVGAIGMYELGNYFFKHRHVALVVALAYAMGGFFTHHLQHFFTIVSVSLFPFTLLMALRFQADPRWKYIFALAILFHLSLTAGNQTFNIINLHLLVFVFARETVLRFREKRQAWKFIRQTFFLVVMVLLTVLPVIIAFIESKAYVYRYGGMEYVKSLAGSMTTTGLLSFLNPFLTTQSPEYLGTDPSMAGYFIGFGVLIFALVFFVFSKGNKKWIFLFLMVVLVLVSLGAATPVHGWAYQVDPLLRLFRCPAHYMFYAYFLLLLAAGYGLVLVAEQKISLKEFLVPCLAVLLGVLFLAVLKGFGTGGFFALASTSGYFEAVQHMSEQATFTFSALLLILTGTGLVLYWRRKNRTILVTFVVLELVVTTNVFMYRSLMPEPASRINSFMAALPKGYALPSNSLHTNAALVRLLPKGMWRNYHGFFDVVSPDFFNSFFTNIRDWEQDTTLQKDLLWQNRREGSVHLKRFEPGLIVFKTPLEKREKLTISQLNYPYWNLYLDGQKTRLKGNTVMEMDAPEGTREVKLVFENPVMLFLFWFSLGTTGLMVLLLLGCCMPRGNFVLAGLVFTGICAGALWPFVFKNAGTVKTLPNDHNEGELLVNKAKTQMENGKTGSYDARFEIEDLLFAILTSKEEKLTYIDSCNFNPPVIRQALAARFNRLTEHAAASVRHYHAGGLKKDVPLTRWFNLGTNVNSGWNIPWGQVMVDSLNKITSCRLTDDRPYGPGTDIRPQRGHSYLFALYSNHRLHVQQGEMLLVMDILRGNKSVWYEARVLDPQTHRLLFHPAYVFEGDETVKISYWLSGKGFVQIDAAALYYLAIDHS